MESEVISTIKACIASCKGGMPISEIEHEYRQLVGGSIPFENLGFTSLGNLITSIPEIAISRSKDGSSILNIRDSKVAHMTRLIERQKPATKKKRKTEYKKSPKSKRREITADKKVVHSVVEKYGNENSYYQQNVPRKNKGRNFFHVSQDARKEYESSLRNSYQYPGHERSVDSVSICEEQSILINSGHRSTTFFDDNLRVTIDNHYNTDNNSSNNSVIILDESLSDKENYPSENEVEPYSNQDLEIFEPTLFHHQMIGDDFFLHLAEKSLGAYTIRKHNEFYKTGLCLSGQRINDCCYRVRKTSTFAKKVILLVGAVDVLEGAEVSDMKSDMLDLIEVLEPKVKSLLILTIPPLVDICHLQQKWATLVTFNKWLTRLDTGFKTKVVNTWPLLRGQRMYDCYEQFPRKMIQSSAFILVWNQYGRKQVTEFLRKIIFSFTEED